MMANVVYLPIGNKLKQATAAEVAHMELVIQGVLSIQAGASPRALGDRLKSNLAPKVRAAMGDKKAA
jgi:chemotaxis protein MotA